MNSYKTISKPLAVLIALFMAVAAVAVIASDDSNAGIVGQKITADGFIENQNGTLHVPVTGISGDVTMKVFEGADQRASADYTVDGDMTLDISFSLSKGTHTLLVQIYKDDAVISSQNTTVESGNNIWSHAGVYVAIVVVVLVVIIIAVVYMRAKPNNKPTTTFTQLEEEKKAAAAKPAAAPSKTEKQTYTGSSKSEDGGKLKYSSSRRK